MLQASSNMFYTFLDEISPDLFHHQNIKSPPKKNKKKLEGGFQIALQGKEPFAPTTLISGLQDDYSYMSNTQ